MAKRESSPGISQAKKQIRYRSGSNFNAEYTRTLDWLMVSDRGKQLAYCKVCSKHFSASHGGIDDVRRHGEGKKHLELFNGFFKKSRIFRALSRIFFFRNLTCLCQPDRQQSKMLFTFDQCGSKIPRNSVFNGHKWQPKTLFLKIFDLCLLIVFKFSIAAYQVCMCDLIPFYIPKTLSAIHSINACIQISVVKSINMIKLYYVIYTNKDTTQTDCDTHP